MSREIKFKFWDNETKQMLGPELDSDQYVIGYYQNMYLVDNNRTDEDGYPYEMDVEILQFTGLRDKNGVEIYEGDIVKNRGYSELCVVNYHQGQYIGRYKPATPFYEFKDVKHGKDLHYIGLGFYVGERDSIEVIGNIHDNPDLLEVPK